ncbi:MAG: DUF4426 domain-containing protein [Ketobacteraceae bacterium]|nr:DUF4426 domain-containing protein [Ketobacteraceae bacterium]
MRRPRLPLNVIYLPVLLLCIALTGTAHAETIEKDGYVIHYSAFNASFLTEEVARAYNLNRSRYRGYVNIAVHRKMKNGETKPVVAQLSGYATRLSGSESSLDFQMVGEGDAIYYLAETIIANRELLRFSINIKPTPSHNPIKLNFEQTFFTDD